MSRSTVSTASAHPQYKREMGDSLAPIRERHVRRIRQTVLNNHLISHEQRLARLASEYQIIKYYDIFGVAWFSLYRNDDKTGRQVTLLMDHFRHLDEAIAALERILVGSVTVPGMGFGGRGGAFKSTGRIYTPDTTVLNRDKATSLVACSEEASALGGTRIVIGAVRGNL